MHLAHSKGKAEMTKEEIINQVCSALHNIEYASFNLLDITDNDVPDSLVATINSEWALILGIRKLKKIIGE